MEPCAIVPLPQTVDLATAFTSVEGEAPLIRVVRSVRRLVTDAHVVVATVPALASVVRDRLRDAGLDVAVAVTSEGGSRQQIIAAGLNRVRVEADSTTPVLIYDVRHPLSPGEVADRVVAALRGGCDAAVPMLAVTDTVKAVNESGSVLGTVDRSTLRTVQYPRGYTASTLWRLISDSTETDDVDEFGAAVRAGLDVGIVDGDSDGFRVELPRDADLLAAIIACRPG